ASLHGLQALRSVFSPDDVARVNQVAGNIAATAVNGNVAMANQLPSLGAGKAKAQSTGDIVQSPFQEAHQRLASIPFALDRALVVAAELPLQDAVIALDLLLLAEVNAIIGQLAAAGGHARRVLAALDGAFGRVAAGSLEEQLHSFAAAQSADGS